jgi:hypothetical protein
MTVANCEFSGRHLVLVAKACSSDGDFSHSIRLGKTEERHVRPVSWVLYHLWSDRGLRWTRHKRSAMYV